MKIRNSKAFINSIAKEVTPSMRYDGKEDFSVWQKKAKAKLAELLKMPQKNCEDDFTILGEQEFDTYKKIDFEYQSEKGYYVVCGFLAPKDIKEKLPVTICLQGHSTGMHISLGVEKFPNDGKTIAGGRDFAVRAVKEGTCAVAIEQRYMGSAGGTESGSPACLGNMDNASMGALLMGRTPIGERVFDIMRLIDVISENFAEYIDTDKIICLGNSGGGTATFYASCMDERIAISVPSCAMCTYEDSIMAMNHCPCNFIPDIRLFFDMGDLGMLIAPRRLCAVCGTEDPIFPVAGVEKSFEIIKKAYKIFGKEDICNLVKGNGGHQFYPDDAWPIIHSYLKNM